MKEDDYMTENNNKCIAFLDILGFKNYIAANENCAYAANILINTNIVLKTKISDQNSHPVNRYPNNLRSLASKGAVTSFEKLLPFSDSIFITSKNADTFIKQLSSFLSECFMFTANEYSNPNDPEHPEHVTEKEYDFDQKCFVNKVSKWYPVLFRGGISYGEVSYCDALSINDSNVVPIPNVIGTGVVNAVKLEKSGSGPKLFIDEKFYKKLRKNNKFFVKTEADGTKYFLWPVYHFISGNKFDDNFSEFKTLMKISKNLWIAYKNKSFGIHYFEFMKLVMDSFVHFCAVEYPNNIDKNKEKIRKYIKEQDIDFAMLNLIK